MRQPDKARATWSSPKDQTHDLQGTVKFSGNWVSPAEVKIVTYIVLYFASQFTYCHLTYHKRDNYFG